MKKMLLLAVPAVLLLLTGCPAQTEKPMDEGSYAVPAWITGKWTTPQGDNYDVKVEKGKMGNATFVMYDSLGHPGKGTPNRIVFSKMGEKVFVSVQTPASEFNIEGYYLYLFKKISDKEVELTAVTESAVDYSSTPDATRKWIMDNKDKPGTYDTTDISRIKKQ